MVSDCELFLSISDSALFGLGCRGDRRRGVGTGLEGALLPGSGGRTGLGMEGEPRGLEPGNNTGRGLGVDLLFS